MLKVYAWNVCPHCKKTVDWLQTHKIPFQYLEIEEQPKEIIQQVIDETGAQSAADMGKVMKAVMPKVKGLAANDLISKTVKELLS